MPQEINLKKLKIVPEDEIVHRTDNEAFVKRVLEILLAKDKKHDQKLEAISQAVQQLMKRMEGKFDMSLGDLRKQVDSLFVGEKMSAMEKKHADMLKGMGGEHQEAMAILDKAIKGIKNGKDGLDGTDGRKMSPEEVRDKLASLEGDERLDASAIKGLDKYDKDIKMLKSRPFGGGGISQAAARDLFVEIDLTGELNGATTEFNMPAVWRIISVELSSYSYGSLRNEVHYTYTPTTIKFLDTIDPTSQLKSDQHCKILAIKA